MQLIRYSENHNVAKDFGPLFESAFPIEERPSLKNLLITLNRPSNDVICYYDNDKFIGFTYHTIYKHICYIFFLAISEECRQMGYGTKILSIVKEIYKAYTLLLGYEELDPKYENYEIRCKRAEFYKKNGFIDNHMLTEEFGERFQYVYIGKEPVSYNEFLEIFKLGCAIDITGNIKLIKGN